jgi:tetratricopeptide (TPR) repeat protein
MALGSAASLAASLDPSTALIEPIVELSLAAAGLLEELDPSQGVERTVFVTRVIRAGAREESGSPLVCLVDDAEWLGEAWWTELQFGFAKEIVEELPLVLVLALDGNPVLPVQPAEECHPGWRLARSLVNKGLADWFDLRPLSSSDVGDWLGRVPKSVASGLLDLTGGRSGEVAGLWHSWLSLGVIAQGKDGWSLVDAEGMTRDAVAELSRRLELLLPNRDRRQDDELARILSCAALEGRVFTAAAVAVALEEDRDAVEDLLDSLVDEADPDGGVLRPPSALRVEDPARRSAQTVWRYEFASPLIWRALQRRLLDPEAVPKLANRMGQALYELYGREFAVIAPTLERLALLGEHPDAASHFRALLRTPDRAVLAERARHLLVADSSGWTTWDHHDAARMLTEASEELWYVLPSSAVLRFCEAAETHVVAAGESGRRILGQTLLIHGRMLIRIGKVAEGEEHLETIRSVSREGDQGTLAEALRALASLKAMQKADLQEAKELLDEATSLYRAIDSQAGEAACKYDLASVYLSEGEKEKARFLTEEALTFARTEKSKELTNATLHQLADIEHLCDRQEIARGHVEEVLSYVTATDNTNDEASSLRLLASIECDLGNHMRARDLASKALDMMRRLEDRNGEAVALWTLARAWVRLGEPARARRLALDARELMISLDSLVCTTEIDEEFGELF